MAKGRKPKKDTKLNWLTLGDGGSVQQEMLGDSIGDRKHAPKLGVDNPSIFIFPLAVQ